MKLFIRLSVLALCILIPAQGMKYSEKFKKIKYKPTNLSTTFLPQYSYKPSKKYSLSQNFQRFISSKKASDLGIKNKGYVVDKNVPKGYERSFGLQYLKNVKNENRNEENIPYNENTPWYKKWWKTIAGTAAFGGLLETVYQNEDNTRKGPAEFCLSYLAQSKTKDGKSINLQEVFEKLYSNSSSNQIETFFDDTAENDVQGDFTIEKKTREIPGFFGKTTKHTIVVTCKIITKDFITKKTNTDAIFGEGFPANINAKCKTGIFEGKEGFNGICNCTFEFSIDDRNTVINYINRNFVNAKKVK